ncbi:unnamed protein product [Penicillium salamii]|nr:unnamed protein product [Penicillium salamii]
MWSSRPFLCRNLVARSWVRVTVLSLPDSYSRKYSLARHFKPHQLPSFFTNPGRPYDIPGYATISVSLPGYLLHLNKSHKISL